MSVQYSILEKGQKHELVVFWYLSVLSSGVEDPEPDPYDRYVFRPPGFGSVSQR